ncbi:amidohydrolase family protein [Schlesneria sp. DSM 10557]|uniref:amidohydrolase family protein n=1 Tax=Schlesneria sp. DSM 10557 TaxID=3044399 RepID=UPI00359F2098
MIDTNVSIGPWPFRKLEGTDLPRLTARLQRNGITQAWAGSLEGLFDRDVAGVNERLQAACQQAAPGLLVPFGTVNPALPAWQEDLRRCAEIHQFKGIRLHPGFHGYDLELPAFEQLLKESAERSLIVQLVATMEDERTQHPVFQVPSVNLTPLAALVKQHRLLRLVVLNAFRKLSLEEAGKLAAAGQVWFDIAMLEGVDRVGALASKVSPQRILLGSHAPLFYVESAVLKLQETTLPTQIIELIRQTNAQELTRFPTAN